MTHTAKDLDVTAIDWLRLATGPPVMRRATD
jgi:hypothetical protein